MSYYVTNENSVLNINNAHLKVSGNIQTDVMKLGAIEFAPPASDVPGTVNFTNVTTGVTTSSNLNVGGTLMLGSVAVVGTPPNTANLHDVVNLGNVTSNTIQFTNATTGIVATGNVEASKFIGDGSLLTGITTIESNVDLTTNTNNTAFINLNSNVVAEFPRSKRVIKYPKVALTQNALNNGYTVTSSTQESSSRAAWKVFNNAYAEGNGWRGTGTYSTSDGSFTGTWVDFSSGSQTISTSDRGDWLRIILPEKIRLEAVRLQPRYSPTTGGTSVSYGRAEFIRNGAIWGSNDGSSWDKVYTIDSGIPASDTSMVTFDGINSTTAYNYFVLVITDTSGTATGTLASFSEWELFGTPEYDPEAHGTDVTIKSVTNVPSTDWLEVYYDAKGLPTGAVSNPISGLGGTTNNGTVYGNPQISDGAFVLDGTGDYISSSVNATLTYHTVSTWIVFDSPDGVGGAWEAVYVIRPNSLSGNDNIAIYGHSDNYFRVESGGGSGAYYDVNYQFVPGKWVHMTVVFKGTGLEDCEVYIDNVKLSPRGVSSNPTTDHTITGTNNLTIGSHPNGTSYNLGGKIANFRLFSRALSSDEIYQLYAYQKEDFGHGDLSMTLKAGRLGIGTSEPRAALDVRGGIYAPGVSIQTVAENVHDIITYPSATSRTINPLTIRITPKFATSKILLQWMINIELIENNLFVIYRNGIKIGYNTSITDNSWVGAMSAAYDLNVDSTLENMYLAWIDTPNTTNVLEYTVVIKSANTTSYPVYFNRTAWSGYGVGGGSGHERTVSFKCATEIA